MANKIDIEIGAIDSASGVLENIFSAIKGGVSAFDLIAVSAMAAANFVRDSTQEAFDYDQQIKSLMITTGGFFLRFELKYFKDLTTFTVFRSPINLLNSKTL